MLTIQEEDVAASSIEELLKKTLKNMKNALDGAGGSSNENFVQARSKHAHWKNHQVFALNLWKYPYQ